MISLMLCSTKLLAQHSACTHGHGIKHQDFSRYKAKRALKKRNEERPNKVYHAHCWAYYVKLQSNSN